MGSYVRQRRSLCQLPSSLLSPLQGCPLPLRSPFDARWRRTRTRVAHRRGSGSLARGIADRRREKQLQTQHSTRPALEETPVEAISLGDPARRGALRVGDLTPITECSLTAISLSSGSRGRGPR